MIVLGIETSCDETACGIVKDGKQVLSSVIASQVSVHARFGGVVPEVASREHLRCIDDIITQALSDANLPIEKIDAVAVTQGPGLIGALLVGASFAKGLAAAADRPLIPVDHVRAHVHGALLSQEQATEELFPCLSLVVSGGHTNLYSMASLNDFELIASSIDDACGECFDKVAKLLNLPYPGGPQIEALARDGIKNKYPMPQMVEAKSRLEFSYSGLKTHMVNLIRSIAPAQLPAKLPDLCASFQEEALGQIMRKLASAVKIHSRVKTILVAGGVSANQRFRDLCAQQFPDKNIVFPQLSYCSDNGAMIAASGYHLFNASKDKTIFSWQKNWDAYSRLQ